MYIRHHVLLMLVHVPQGVFEMTAQLRLLHKLLNFAHYCVNVHEIILSKACQFTSLSWTLLQVEPSTCHVGIFRVITHWPAKFCAPDVSARDHLVIFDIGSIICRLCARAVVGVQLRLIQLRSRGSREHQELHPSLLLCIGLQRLILTTQH